tara:strand:+ start:1192 stop:3699 length:2508 start_codon:yes stop_codon:yes gene_type:complete
MVDKIDKALPNVKEKAYIESPEEIQIEESKKIQEVNDQGIEVTENEDGSAEIEFEPGKVAAGGGEEHFSNLADILPDDIINRLASVLYQNYEDYKNSRKDWEQSYTTGLDLLGFKYVNRSQPFQGASGATHPVLAEAVTQFQATAYKELLPADGPVRTQILGMATREKEDQAARVKEYMNYQIMNQMPEYEAEFDQMLFYLPLAGSSFKKVYYDEIIGRAVSKFVQADDLIVPYSATSLEDAEAIFQRMYMSENDIRKAQVSGFYSDIELGHPNFTQDRVHEEERKLEGTRKTYSSTAADTTFTVLECHINLDLEGFEDIGEDGEPTGIKLPYIVTLEAGARQILSIRRNYQPNDPLKKKVHYFVHFKFLPGLGFYGFGLIHMIGGLSRTATVALRQLLDAGTLSNLPAGFKMRGIRVRDDAQPLQPGEFRDVDAPGGSLKEAFYPLPYKEPSQTLLQLMGIVVQAGQRFASIADMQVGDGNQQAAVGTTVALLERGSRVMSAIHKRLYNGLKKEFKLLANIFAQYLPAEYPYDVVGGQRMIKQMDFDERVDIVPVADPNIFSMTQRITLAQTELQLAMSNPQMHNLYASYRNMYNALGIKNIDQLLPPPPPPTPKDPALEHIDAMAMKPFQAYRNQDHRAHITAHMNFMATNFARNNPPIMAALEKNIFEHISLMAQEHIELEFAKQIMEMQQAQQQGLQGPEAQQKMQELNLQMEARKAVLIAEYTGEFMTQEKEITSMLDSDPLIKLKAQELDLKAMENFRKKEETEARINLDKTKLMQNRDLTEQKLEQNEDLAEMRAETSLVKQQMSNQAKMQSDVMKRKDVKTLKGPRS